MKGWNRAQQVALTLLAISGAETWVAAEPAPQLSLAEPVRPVYRAPAGCPSEETFRAELGARLSGAAIAELDTFARQISVAIEARETGYHARLDLLDSSGRPVAREVSAASCDQVVQVIALIAALAARSQFEEAAAAARMTPPVEPVETPAVPADTQEPAPVAPANDPRSDAQPSPRARQKSAVPRRHWELLFGVTASTGVGPGVAPGVALRGQLARGSRGELAWPIGALSAAYYDTFRKDLPEAEVQFRQFTLRPEFCPIGGASRAFGAGGCLGLELGATFAEAFNDGTRVIGGRSTTKFWSAATLAGRLRGALGGARLELGPELRFPFVRHDFAISNPTVSVYTVPWMAIGVAAVAGGSW